MPSAARAPVCWAWDCCASAGACGGGGAREAGGGAQGAAGGGGAKGMVDGAEKLETEGSGGPAPRFSWSSSREMQPAAPAAAAGFPATAPSMSAASARASAMR